MAFIVSKIYKKAISILLVYFIEKYVPWQKKKIEISFHPSSLLLSLPFFLPHSPFLSLITSQSSSFFFLPFFLLSHIPNLFISLSFFLPVSSSIFSSSFYVIFLLNLMNPSLSKVLLLSTVSHFIPVCSS